MHFKSGCPTIRSTRPDYVPHRRLAAEQYTWSSHIAHHCCCKNNISFSSKRQVQSKWTLRFTEIRTSLELIGLSIGTGVTGVLEVKNSLSSCVCQLQCGWEVRGECKGLDKQQVIDIGRCLSDQVVYRVRTVRVVVRGEAEYDHEDCPYPVNHFSRRQGRYLTCSRANEDV